MSEPAPPDGSGRFLHRWSARKREAPSARSASADDPSGDPSGDPSDDTLAALDRDAGPLADTNTAADPATGTDRELTTPPLTDADMPSVESLTETSDLSGFFSDGVSATLRKAALRRVFSGAAFNRRDGLNDYDGDYTVFEPLGDTVTADMKYHAARRERLERERAEADARLQRRSADEEAGSRASAQREEADAEADAEVDAEVDETAPRGDGAVVEPDVPGAAAPESVVDTPHPSDPPA